MPAPVISGFVDFIQKNLNIDVWEGEVPRVDEAGTTVVLIDNTPIFRVTMEESGFAVDPNFENTRTDDGIINIEIWTTARQDTEGYLEVLDTLFSNSSNWPAIQMGANFTVYSLLLERWYSGQEEDIRTRDNDLLYRGDLRYQVGINGAYQTR